MFNPITTTAIEVTGTTGRSACGTDMQGYFFEIDRFKNFFAKFLFFIRRISAACRKFFIGTSRIVAYKTIDILFRGKIKRIIFPIISCMAAGAPAPVRFNGYSVIIKDIFLADPLLYTT